MPANIDELQIEISAEANKAKRSIDSLVSRLDVLSKSLGKLNGASFSNFANGMKSLADGMNLMKDVKPKNFADVAKGVAKFNDIDSAKLSTIGNALAPLSQGISTLANTKFDNKNMSNLINSLTRLSNSNINGLMNVDFSRLGNSINALATSLSSAPKINQSVISMTNAVASLAKSANNIPIVTSSLAGLGSSMKSFMVDMSTSATVSSGTLEFTRAIASLANAGANAGATASNLSALGVGIKDLMATLSRAPVVSGNVIQMTQALANLANQGSRVGSASRSMVTGLANTRTAMTRTTKSTFSLASAFGMFYARYFLVIRGLKKLWSAISGTSDYIESFNYYTVAMGKVASKWDENWENYGSEMAQTFNNSFITTLNDSFSKLSGLKIDVSEDFKTGLLSENGMKNLGLNIQEVTKYASQLASMMDSIGQSGKTTLAATDAMVKLAGDISSLYNIDYESAAKNIQSVLMGQSRAGYKFGWDTTMASLQSLADKFNLSKPVSEMEQMEKQQLRLLAILEQSKVSYGDLANTINSPSNMIRQLTNNLKEAGMVLGQLFVPMLQKVLPVLNGITIAIKRLLGSIAEFFGISLDLSQFGQGYTEMEDGMDGLSDSLDSVTESAKKAKAGLRGFDELKTISVPSASSGSGGAGSGTIDLTDEILKATEEYNKVWQEAYDKMENRAEKFAKKVEKALKPIKKLFKDLAIGDYFAVGEDVSNIVSGINNFFARAIERVDWQKIGKNIGDFMAGINWTQILSSFGRLFWAGVNGAIDMWKGSFKSAPIETTILSAVVGMSLLASAFSSLASLAGKIVVFFTPLINIFSKLKLAIGGLFAEGGLFGAGGAIATASGPVIALVAALSALVIGLGYVFAKNEEVRQSFFESVDAIMGNLKPALDVITNNVLPELRNGWNRLVSIMKPFADFLNNVFVSIWQDFINPALMYVGETVLPKVISTFSNLWNNVLVPFGQFLGNKLEPRIKILSSILQMLWENVVVPLGNAIGSILATSFENFVDVLNNRVIPVANTVISVFNFMYEKVFTPIITFLVEQMKPKFENTFSTIGGIIDGLSTTLSGLITYITGTFALDWEMAWSGIKDSFKGVINVIISIFEGMINKCINGLNGFFGGISGALSKVSGVVGIDIDVPKIKEVELPRFKAGGFPQKYSLFMAGEDGIPEIAGTVGGRTAVAGGAEITGIRDAIYSTSMQEMQLIREQNALLRGILDKEFGISPDAVFRSVKSSASDYTRRTGKPAFN